MTKHLILLLFFIAPYLTAELELTFDGVTLPAPSGWTVVAGNNSSPALTLSSPSKLSTITIAVSSYSGAELDVAGQNQLLQEALAKLLSNVVITSSGKDFIEYTATQNRINYSFYQKHIPIGSKLFIFTYTAATENYLESRPLFLDLTNQFRSLNLY